MRYVILRDDDTSAVTPPECLERLYRPFLARGLPVNLAVIPEVRTDVRIPDGSLEGFLAAGRGTSQPLLPIAANRELVGYLHSEPAYRIVQHGCHHDYFEFDGCARERLSRRLDQGGRRLVEAGFDRPRAFVAPYDKISRVAYPELARRFAVISTGWFEARRIPFRWWVPFLCKKAAGRRHWRGGGTWLLGHPGCLLSCHRPYDVMFDSVRQAVDRATLTVIVTHWWEYFRGGVADAPFIAILHQVADWLAGSADIKVVSFADVASGAVPLGRG